MIRKLDNIMVLDTEHTTYCFKILPTGQLEHLYYGEKIIIDSAAEAEVLSEKHAFAPGNTNVYDAAHTSYSLEDMRLEMSSYGKGDIREPFVELVHADGGMTSDFVYDKSQITEGKEPFITLPGSYEENGKVEHLTVTMKDHHYGLVLELNYYVFPQKDVITRASKLINESEDSVWLKRLMSTQLDFETDDYILTTFNGSWAREMQRHDIRICAGKHVNASYTGTSSNRANPFVMLSKETTSEDAGICYGMNLIYSGNHYEAAEVNGYHKTRFVAGINPQSFSFEVRPGEFFESPEAVMTCSTEGFHGMSSRMHAFVRACICRGEWRDKIRPVLLNSWEAAYFDISENKLLKLAKAGTAAGIELFVMDDGWFGHRNDDKSSLGDWYVNKKKLPNGLEGLASKINDLGLDFGIWVEPEMVNTDSDLYRAHPEWTMEIPGKPHSEGRNQRILDLANPKVVEYIIEEMTKVFSSANISYVKWDMNRIFSDYYSQYLDHEHQGETAHRYVLGLYYAMKTLTERFPKILFEGCAAGGNRFDLGILSYFPQIWASDDTDAAYRVQAQTNYSYGYPMSCVSAHVSACPNHQTLRNTPLDTRFHVAAFGVCGYECNFCDMSKEELRQIKEQIALYKEWREVLQHGEFYRGKNGQNLYEWTCVSKDGKKAVGMLMQYMVQPNTQFEQYIPKGLIKEDKYKLFNQELTYNIKEFGDLVNTQSPIHIKQGSLVQHVVSRFVTMPGEKEDMTASGSLLMNGGIKLKQAFGATGYSDEVRYFQDFSSRMYFLKSMCLADRK